MLLIVIRLLEAGLEMGLQGQRAVLRSSERIGAECQVSVYLEVVYSETCEIVLSERIPFQVFLILSICSCIEVNRVLDHVAAAFEVIHRLEAVIACQLVSQSDIDLGHDRFGTPWLESHEHAVFKPHDPEGIGALCRIQIKTVMVEISSEIVCDDVSITLAEYRIFTAVAYEGCGDSIMYAYSQRVCCQCKTVCYSFSQAVGLSLFKVYGDLE